MSLSPPGAGEEEEEAGPGVRGEGWRRCVRVRLMVWLMERAWRGGRAVRGVLSARSSSASDAHAWGARPASGSPATGVWRGSSATHENVRPRIESGGGAAARAVWARVGRVVPGRDDVSTLRSDRRGCSTGVCGCDAEPCACDDTERFPASSPRFSAVTCGRVLVFPALVFAVVPVASVPLSGAAPGVGVLLLLLLLLPLRRLRSALRFCGEGGADSDAAAGGTTSTGVFGDLGSDDDDDDDEDDEEEDEEEDEDEDDGDDNDEEGGEKREHTAWASAELRWLSRECGDCGSGGAVSGEGLDGALSLLPTPPGGGACTVTLVFERLCCCWAPSPASTGV